MTLKSDLTAAVAAARTAFKTALDEDFDENKLSELWRHYLGLKFIAKEVPDDVNPIASFGITGGMSDDTINFDGYTYTPDDFGDPSFPNNFQVFGIADGLNLSEDDLTDDVDKS